MYRDSLAGLKSQVATKRAAVASRELSPILRALLPDALRDALAELEPRALAEGESMEALTDADAALDAILAHHDEAQRLSPKLRESSEEVADPAPPAMSPPWLMEEDRLIAFRDAFARRILELAPEAFLVRFGDFAYITRFRITGGPYAIVANAFIDPDGGLGASRCALVVRTSVPASLPSLVLRPEGLHHVIGKALHLASELEVGDRVLDAQFWITGARATTAVLTPAVRAALDALSPLGPVLRIGNGMATLAWSGTWIHSAREVLPDAALDALVGIRAAVEIG